MKRKKILALILTTPILVGTFALVNLQIAFADSISLKEVTNSISDSTNSSAAFVNDSARMASVSSEKNFYSFDTIPDNNKIINEVTGIADASLKANATIVDDTERGKVLSLPGGANGTGGSLILPSNLFEDISETKGFTIAMWVKVAPSNENSGGWSRFFDAGTTDFGTGTPPYIFASSYCGTDLNSGSAKGMSGFTPIENKWTHIAFSVTGEKQTFYINGVPVKTDDSNAEIFKDIKSFTLNSIGQSRFSADNDLKGLVDDVKFFDSALSNDEIAEVVGNDNNVALKSYSVKGKTIEVPSGQTNLRYETNTYTTYSVNDIIPVPASPIAKCVVSPVDGELNKFKVNVTSSNNKNTAEYTIKCVDISNGAVLNFDATKSTGEIKHGVTGFLYGVSEANVPTMDLLSAIKPKFLVQKAADGLQHPTGDAARVNSAMREVGVENVQVYLQDLYLQWPYEYTSIDDYKEKVKIAVHKMVDGKTQEEKASYSYVLFNEPDAIWYSGNENGFFEAWKIIYDLVKSIDPNAKVAGPNNTNYNYQWYEDFFKYCKENNCLPEIITWHELYDGADKSNSLVSYKDHYNDMQRIIKTYYSESNIKPQIVINEYSLFENIGGAGSLVKWLSMFEETKVSACLPYWGLANTLNELSADTNKPNSAWWLYKWYSDMQGHTVNLTTYNVDDKGTYGLTSIDENNKTAYSIFGGESGMQTININKLNSTTPFKDATLAHVKLYKTKFTGHQGFQYAPSVEFDGNLALNNGNLQIQLTNCNALDGYYAIITPSTGSVSTIDKYDKNWTETYEAEDAILLGNAKIVKKAGINDLLCSNRSKVENINDKKDGVEFGVSIPKDGKYKLDIYYGNKAPNVDPKTLEIKEGGQNRAIGKVVEHQLSIDGIDNQILNYDSTVKAEYIACKTVYIDLKAGTHKLKLMHYGSDQSNIDQTIRQTACLDKIDLTYDSEINGKISTPTIKVECEEVLGKNSYSFDNTLKGFTGGGYASGSENLSFTVIAKEDGLYDTSLIYNASNYGKVSMTKTAVDYPKDATVSSRISEYQLPVGEFKTSKSNDWRNSTSGQVYLTAGANTITLSSEKTIHIDSLTFTKNKQIFKDNTTVIQAARCELSGDASVKNNDYSSNNKIVTNIGNGNKNSKLTIKVNADKAGSYKLSMFYANNEPAPAMTYVDNGVTKEYIHPYNTDLVERYAQIVINDKEPETVFFKNTLSWDVFKNVVIDVALKAGENTIEIYNDNSYQISPLVNSSAPNFDKFEITPASINN